MAKQHITAAWIRFMQDWAFRNKYQCVRASEPTVEQFACCAGPQSNISLQWTPGGDETETYFSTQLEQHQPSKSQYQHATCMEVIVEHAGGVPTHGAAGVGGGEPEQEPRPACCAGPRLCARLPAPGEGAAGAERAAGCHLQGDPVPHNAPLGSEGQAQHQRHLWCASHVWHMPVQPCNRPLDLSNLMASYLI